VQKLLMEISVETPEEALAQIQPLPTDVLGFSSRAIESSFVVHH
jgi:hypothetical protein